MSTPIFIPYIEKEYIAALYPSTVANINSAGYISWDDSIKRELDDNWSVITSNQVAKFNGTPRKIEITVQVQVTSTFSRVNQIVAIWRMNDLKIIGTCSTGYIRNTNGHNTSSYNFTAVDFEPVANPEYRIRRVREANAGNSLLDVSNCFFILQAYM